MERQRDAQGQGMFGVPKQKGEREMNMGGPRV